MIDRHFLSHIFSYKSTRIRIGATSHMRCIWTCKKSKVSMIKSLSKL